MTIDKFIRKALCVPFLEKGRSYDGWDCYGLIYAYFRDVAGVSLPVYDDYSSTKAYDELKSLIEEGKSAWDEVNCHFPGDVVLFTLSGRPYHIGLVVDYKNMLHTEKRAGTFVESFTGSLWARRIEGVYRCRA